MSQNDIPIDAIYSAVPPLGMPSDQKKTHKIPIKQYDIWEDYKQIYLDFSLTTD